MFFKLSFIFKSYLGFGFYNNTTSLLMLEKNLKHRNVSSDSVSIVHRDGRVTNPTTLINFFNLSTLPYNSLVRCKFCDLYRTPNYQSFYRIPARVLDSSNMSDTYFNHLLYQLNRKLNILGLYFCRGDFNVFYDNDIKYYTLRDTPTAIKVYTVDQNNKHLFAMALSDGTYILDHYLYPNSFNNYSYSCFGRVKYIGIDPKHILVRDKSEKLFQSNLVKALIVNNCFSLPNDPNFYSIKMSLLDRWRFSGPHSAHIKCSFFSKYKPSLGAHLLYSKFNQVTLNEHIKGDLVPTLLHMLNKKFNYIGYYFIYDECDLNRLNSHWWYTLEDSNLIKVFKVSDWNTMAFLLGLRMGFHNLDGGRYRVFDPNWGEDPSLGVVRYIALPVERIIVRSALETYHSIRLKNAMAFLYHSNPVFYMSWETR